MRRKSAISRPKPNASDHGPSNVLIWASHNTLARVGVSTRRIIRDQYVTPLRSQSSRERRRLAVAAAVEAALRRDRLLFAFQPVVCAATGRVDYFECLLRMRGERGAIFAGAEFITIVEELGLIGLIDCYVLEKAVQELAADPQIRLGFNISGLTAGDRRWLQLLISLLRHRSEIARRLVVEITETAALCDIEQSARFVDTLREAGCRVALDDFGAGHTTLRHLQILPVDIVKIDGSLVRNLTSRPQDRVFLRHLLGLTKGFGLTTVAECIENAEDAALLRAEGIGYLQGYHFGRPTIGRASLGTTERATP
jgi:EAL domain-containing protein (putative c-di-GMP-specific phosphodiesterase class I)